MSGVPVLNEGVDLRREESGKMILRVRLLPEVGWMDRFRPRVDTRRYELDDFGSFVVARINGNHTVLEIINGFQEAFGMSRRESELGVVAFIKMLMKRRLLSVGVCATTGPGNTPLHHHA